MNPLTYKSVETAKTGLSVPVFADGKAMYSRYNPERDAQIFAAGVPETTGCILVCGLGSALHIKALRRKLPDAKIIVTEVSEQNIRFLKEHFDMSDICHDRDIVICTQEQTEQVILDTYIPILHGNFLMAPLRSWADFHADHMTDIKDHVRSALEKLTADSSTQAHFGRIWHRNILQNLLTAQTLQTRPIPVPAAKRKAIVIAAGPTLDATYQTVEQNKHTHFIIAVDTVLPALTRRNIIPDAAVTIDGNSISASHFCGRLAAQTAVIADLCASPPAVRHAVHCGCAVLFTRNRHPLSALASEYFKNSSGFSIPELDSGAGTVTVAALDFAVKAGFTDITVIGADFGYSAGKPYAKGTYLDDFYNRYAKRTLPQEQQFTALMYKTPVHMNAAGILSNKTIDAYRGTFCAYVESHADVRINWNGTVYRTEKKAGQVPAEYMDMVSRNYNGYAFLEWYLDLLQKKDQKAVPSILPLALWSKAKLNYKSDVFSLLKLAYTQTVRYTDKYYGT